MMSESLNYVKPREAEAKAEPEPGTRSAMSESPGVIQAVSQEAEKGITPGKTVVLFRQATDRGRGVVRAMGLCERSCWQEVRVGGATLSVSTRVGA